MWQSKLQGKYEFLPAPQNCGAPNFPGVPEQAFMLQAGRPLKPLACKLGPPKLPLNTSGLRPARLWARNMRVSRWFPIVALQILPYLSACRTLW